VTYHGESPEMTVPSPVIPYYRLTLDPRRCLSHRFT